MIELSEPQRQALADNPQETRVLDPTTHTEYILVRADLYARMRELLEQARSGSEEPPLRQPIRELPLPPEVAATAKRYCQRLGLRGEKSLRQAEEQMKLQHYYGGKWVAYLRTDDGPVIVATAQSLCDPAFEQQLASLTEEERKHRVLECPVRLCDAASEILTPFSDAS